MSTHRSVERTESEYYEFREFDLANARQVLSYYVDYFPTGPVLELACGTGVFLGLLAENGVTAQGVDLDPGMVEAARANGHDVVLDDAIGYLEAQPDRSLAGLFAAHFLEHLPSERVQDVYTQAARVLVDGGIFVAAVPNAACMSVLTTDFWRDPTHVRFYDPLALEYFAHSAGLEVTDSGGNPRNHPGPPPHLHVTPLPAVGSLTDDIRLLIDKLPAAAAASLTESVHGIAHLLNVMDERFQRQQHQLQVQADVHERLLAQLYPANEVYVAVRRPTTDSANSAGMS